MSAPDRSAVTKALVTFITAETDALCAALETPTGASKRTDSTRAAYAIVYPITGTLVRGDLANPEALVGWAYQVDSVGFRPDQAQNLDDAIRAALTGRVGSGFANELTPAGATVSDREVIDSGAVVPTDDSLFAIHSTYRLWTENS